MATRRDATSPATPPPDRFRLVGPSATIDPRTVAVRRDIADVALAGELFAPHYVQPVSHGLAVASATMRAVPDGGAPAVSQLVQGELFAVLDVAAGWAWGYSGHDHYVGYLPADALGATFTATHVVAAPSALVFATADIKAPVVTILPIGSRLRGREEGDFVATGDGFVHRRHVVPADACAQDAATVAESLIGLPYRWGGRGGGGIDCSGLVQVALGRAGHAAPRDSDQQRGIGRELDETEPLERGDLIFFPGHVGLMADATRLIHANAHAMAVTVEPLADVIARLAPLHDWPVLARRRVAAA